MTNHKATPGQWMLVERQAREQFGRYSDSCLLEIRDRLAAAEQRIEAMEGVANLRQQDEDAERAMAPLAGGLVKQVGQALIRSEPGYDKEACAAILAVAEWLDGRIETSAAHLLREEVERGH